MTLQDERNPEQPMSPRGRGFAGMDPARQRDIAREGGRAAHEKGTAHEFTPEEARAAGLKSRMNRLARTPEEARAAGLKSRMNRLAREASRQG